MRTTFLAALAVLVLATDAAPANATPPGETTTGAARSSVYVGKGTGTKQLATTTDDAGTGEVTLKTVTTPDPASSQVVSYPAMARTTGACLSATWGVDIDGGPQGLLLAADGGVPDPKIIYVCTATGDGCFKHTSQPHACSFAARFFASGVTFETFPNDPNDASVPTPQVYGLGIGASTTFDCCPYVSQ